MSSAKVLVNRLYSLDARIHKTIMDLDKIIEEKLGDGWGVTQQTDGICLIDDDSNNYPVGSTLLIELLKMPREEALQIIKKHAI